MPKSQEVTTLVFTMFIFALVMGFIIKQTFPKNTNVRDVIIDESLSHGHWIKFNSFNNLIELQNDIRDILIKMLDICFILLNVK